MNKSIIERGERMLIHPYNIRGTRLSTNVMLSRWQAGETIGEMYLDYFRADEERPTRDEIVAAVYFEMGRRERWNKKIQELLTPDVNTRAQVETWLRERANEPDY